MRHDSLKSDYSDLKGFPTGFNICYCVITNVKKVLKRNCFLGN